MTLLKVFRDFKIIFQGFSSFCYWCIICLPPMDYLSLQNRGPIDISVYTMALSSYSRMLAISSQRKNYFLSLYVYCCCYNRFTQSSRDCLYWPKTDTKCIYMRQRNDYTIWCVSYGMNLNFNSPNWWVTNPSGELWYTVYQSSPNGLASWGFNLLVINTTKCLVDNLIKQHQIWWHLRGGTNPAVTLQGENHIILMVQTIKRKNPQRRQLSLKHLRLSSKCHPKNFMTIPNHILIVDLAYFR